MKGDGALAVDEGLKDKSRPWKYIGVLPRVARMGLEVQKDK